MIYFSAFCSQKGRYNDHKIFSFIFIFIFIFISIDFDAQRICVSNAESEAYSAAVKAKDLDALLDVGNALSAPCEVCRQFYHPGVTVGP